MNSQKIAQQSLRRLAVQQPFAMRSTMMRSPVAILGQNIQKSYRTEAVLTKESRYRQVTSSPNTEDPNQILVQQRLRRPVAPHLSIYKPQITWIGSSLHRITGCALSGTLYLWATAYLASPALGWHLESATMVASFGALPLAAKILFKSTLALPFTYHCINGIRHLVWDTGRALTNPAIIKTGWTVVGLSVASAIGLALI
ncbi:unnamed protein product [Penicillium salamii]|uniref:Succinate dehydrogenase cytochrome b560 subunit n=1 Tax=Penicillium salamii TaxID=1612424 RepID=A0A9W4NQ97_9EURO|nr:unnamed protein product [Penicillium salamii]CAG8188031.1 unnamed protein product [Penicillium salamii]CAG8200057.1 unnamed protein product [Penicillium salamii]CAG8205843.1 unnamed protein product [Penicillium salamii]CAG8227519.1 unnamed protein product [Penicillium salamii]